MRYYEIYSINSAVANDYFGRDEKLFQLFMEMKVTSDMKMQVILSRQIDYITTKISSIDVHECIHRHILNHPDQYRNKRWADNRLYDSEGFVNLYCYPNRILLEASGNGNQETGVFEALRSMDCYFLAIDCQKNCGGWLKPVKSVSLI
ncbi:hypothetical protein JOD43_002451 [Pullulanibacillus pueri]|uniref:Sporulation inhibitor of replication protein SirA n=1 Tax=Pullulanibacillus pueri TaxID=1437324 RepID=A0A8J3EMK3_9BACL|nr:sporulation inhibitor of replication protein SirA [Pullulanibacillus pueri]MBM7682276.1 hypothetical protein [Pullulanibacillus pueri]GGH80982.1 hypothetical protein GCM10007096_18200 [Pullulanibacillus pueri]